MVNVNIKSKKKKFALYRRNRKRRYEKMRYKDNEQLKNELKAEWTRKGLTQGEVAERAGLSSANLSNILVNKKSLTFADVQKLCNALDLDLYIEFRDRANKEE